MWSSWTDFLEMVIFSVLKSSSPSGGSVMASMVGEERRLGRASRRHSPDIISSILHACRSTVQIPALLIQSEGGYCSDTRAPRLVSSTQPNAQSMATARNRSFPYPLSPFAVLLVLLSLHSCASRLSWTTCSLTRDCLGIV